MVTTKEQRERLNDILILVDDVEDYEELLRILHMLEVVTEAE